MSEKKYLYGPVPSRRLGLSYGVDIVPFKTCTLDCVYCQLGRTTEKTVERRHFASVAAALSELREALAEFVKADFITVGGSGEPTLHLGLGELVRGIKEITDIRLALLTNGTLFIRPDVRADCAGFDVILPSLDAGDEQTFQRVDRPAPSISIESVISGLCALREEFHGQMWVEVFLVPPINTGDLEITNIKRAIDRIRPDKVQLNTAVRPTADLHVRMLDSSMLCDIAAKLGPTCEVVADSSLAPVDQAASRVGLKPPLPVGARQQAVLSMIRRRPCSAEDISKGLSVTPEEVGKYVADLLDRGLITVARHDGRLFFTSAS